MSIWRIFAWISIACGLLAYFMGWLALVTKTIVLVSTEFWFYDSVAAGIFGMFFLIYSIHSKKER